GFLDKSRPTTSTISPVNSGAPVRHSAGSTPVPRDVIALEISSTPNHVDQDRSIPLTGNSGSTPSLGTPKITCGECGATVDEDMPFCPNCAAPL
ncbi:zinc ribbon domain-containing protein, partial [Myxococcota bacterium]|nr:zinc ribbon domain-containing protein [Myxococcota bacterium]